MAQWLRCCATNWKVAGSKSDGIIGIFHWHYSPGVDSASNRNEYQEDFLGVNVAGAYGWQPYHLPVSLSWNMGTLTSWYPLGHSRPVTGILDLYIHPDKCNIDILTARLSHFTAIRSLKWKSHNWRVHLLIFEKTVFSHLTNNKDK